ncbi:ETC complex I subunit [Sediminicoccus sp. KRV36]|uniref:ETC complex I subunit n=1 Tax=Sediminicoccus sp. KRV36 TaxID=3133721 RepID=UPI00200CD316|nr:ETC complex I subunit [Sediminicoccus rosea]UPY38696.1 ETC complex I subunit [Sediminicoccus rosea]
MSLVVTKARIFQPPRSAMQSGRANTQEWALEFTPPGRSRLDPLTGWIGSAETTRQVRLHFPTREAAIAYAEAQGIAHEVEEPTRTRPIKPKVYADNFRTNRPDNWTH